MLKFKCMETSLNKFRLSNKTLAIILFIFIFLSVVNLFAVLTESEVIRQITSKISMPLEWIFVLWAAIRLYKVSDKYKVVATCLSLVVLVPLFFSIFAVLQIIDLESLINTVQTSSIYSLANTLTGVFSLLITCWGAYVLYKLR